MGNTKKGHNKAKKTCFHTISLKILGLFFFILDFLRLIVILGQMLKISAECELTSNFSKTGKHIQSKEFTSNLL